MKMSFHGKRFLLPFAALCTCALVQWAQAQSLPKGEEILDKFAEVTGEKDAREKIKNRVEKGTMEIGGVGIKGPLAIYSAAPNKMYFEADLAGFGKVEEGTDGTVAWGTNPATGPRVKEGVERDSFLRRADFYRDIDWRKQYKKAECTGEEAVEGKPCYKVKLTSTDGQERTQYYDKSTGLLVKATGTEKTEMGDIPVDALIGDYKKVDGVLLPFKVRQKILTNEITITLDKIEHNVKLPENRFDLPNEVKKLAEKDKKKP
jgi:Protein of unknown function (DUF620)